MLVLSTLFAAAFCVATLASTGTQPRSVRDVAWKSVTSSLLVGASLVSAAAAASASSSTTTSTFTSIEDAAKYIEQNCGKTLSANRNSGRFFYRGESALPKRQASLVVSAGDLLSPQTYAETGSPSEGVAAADYFKSLDQAVLDGVGLFSTGHICTSSQQAASLWGPLHTVFPLDERFNFLYYRKEPELWQGAWSTPQGAPRGAPAFFWRDKEYLRAFLRDNAVISSGLEGALSSEHELVFSNNGGYVAIPIAFENKVATLLGVEQFSPSVTPARASQMEVDDVRRSSRDRFIVY